MIHIYTGDGKGKTTAAIGLAVRALGHGFNVVFAQFLKGNVTGEVSSLEDLGAEIIRAPRQHGFWWTLGNREKDVVRREHDQIIRTVLGLCRSGRPPELLVLDEFTYVYNCGMADPKLCEELLHAVGRRTEVVITGRDPGPLADKADYLSEIKAVRHPFNAGCPARKGIEF